MRVDIWSDVICPWCYVGKARFEKALSSFAHRDEVEVVYHSFELDPSSPRGQRESNLAMLSKKFGKSPAEALAMDDQVGSLARAEGLGFDSGRPVGNTFDIHRVLHLGLDRGVQQELLSAVNEAYFAQARDVFDRDVLTEVAAGAGLDAGGGRQGLRRGRLRRRGPAGRTAGTADRHQRRPVLRVRHGARRLRRAADGAVHQRAQPGLGTPGLTSHRARPGESTRKWVKRT